MKRLSVLVVAVLIHGRAAAGIIPFMDMQVRVDPLQEGHGGSIALQTSPLDVLVDMAGVNFKPPHNSFVGFVERWGDDDEYLAAARTSARITDISGDARSYSISGHYQTEYEVQLYGERVFEGVSDTLPFSGSAATGEYVITATLNSRRPGLSVVFADHPGVTYGESDEILATYGPVTFVHTAGQLTLSAITAQVPEPTAAIYAAGLVSCLLCSRSESWLNFRRKGI